MVSEGQRQEQVTPPDMKPYILSHYTVIICLHDCLPCSLFPELLRFLPPSTAEKYLDKSTRPSKLKDSMDFHQFFFPFFVAPQPVGFRPEPHHCIGSFNSLAQARDGTCILVLQRCHQFCGTTAGMPHHGFLFITVSYLILPYLIFS